MPRATGSLRNCCLRRSAGNVCWNLRRSEPQRLRHSKRQRRSERIRRLLRVRPRISRAPCAGPSCEPRKARGGPRTGGQYATDEAGRPRVRHVAAASMAAAAQRGAATTDRPSPLANHWLRRQAAISGGRTIRIVRHFLRRLDGGSVVAPPTKPGAPPAGGWAPGVPNPAGGRPRRTPVGTPSSVASPTAGDTSSPARTVLVRSSRLGAGHLAPQRRVREILGRTLSW